MSLELCLFWYAVGFLFTTFLSSLFHIVNDNTKPNTIAITVLSVFWPITICFFLIGTIWVIVMMSVESIIDFVFFVFTFFKKRVAC